VIVSGSFTYMEPVETLLTILVVIISSLVLIGLILVIIVAVALRKLVKKAQLIADKSNTNLSLLKSLLVKNVGVFSLLKLLMKIKKR
jgi:hypothetical protein